MSGGMSVCESHEVGDEEMRVRVSVYNEDMRATQFARRVSTKKNMGAGRMSER